MKMKRLMFRFAVALVTFVIGISVTAVWFFCRQPYSQQKELLCRSCAEISSATSDIKTVAFSALIHNPENYSNQVIRLRAILHNDAGYKSLLDPTAVKGSREQMLTEFADPDYDACKGVKKALYEIAGVNNWFDGSADVILIGRLGQFQSGFRSGDSGFVILRVERACPIGMIAP